MGSDWSVEEDVVLYKADRSVYVAGGNLLAALEAADFHNVSRRNSKPKRSGSSVYKRRKLLMQKYNRFIDLETVNGVINGDILAVGSGFYRQCRFWHLLNKWYNIPITGKPSLQFCGALA